MNSRNNLKMERKETQNPVPVAFNQLSKGDQLTLAKPIKLILGEQGIERTSKNDIGMIDIPAGTTLTVITKDYTSASIKLENGVTIGFGEECFPQEGIQVY